MNINERAAQMAPLLMVCANKRIVLSYNDIYKSTGMNMAGIGKALNIVKNVCKDHDLPPLTTIVIRKDDGQAGDESLNDDFQKNMADVFKHDWYDNGFPIINEILEK